MREKWNVNKPEVVAALMEVVRSRDPDMMIDAIKCLIQIDAIDLKQEEIESKQNDDSELRKLRLLEIAQRLGIGEVSSIDSRGSETD